MPLIELEHLVLSYEHNFKDLAIALLCHISHSKIIHISTILHQNPNQFTSGHSLTRLINLIWKKMSSRAPMITSLWAASFHFLDFQIILLINFCVLCPWHVYFLRCLWNFCKLLFQKRWLLLWTSLLLQETCTSHQPFLISAFHNLTFCHAPFASLIQTRKVTVGITSECAKPSLNHNRAFCAKPSF